ncbi:MAG: NAD(P)/FAD-dependent oxidoreductase [Wenzhouxiangellaceae bacterium]|nr:NAD(P)/FAD-dependent oxidoreductase [Wenzhouxiangellaceae bacterium]
MSEQQILDTAIVGGGVSGLYCAWRIARARADERVTVFEGSDRTGGRLWSVTLKDEHAVPAELGGMFFSDAQDLVYRLCRDVLDLEIQQVVPRDDFAWLRGKRFEMSDFAKPGVLPYHLADDEIGLQSHEILLMAVRRMAPDIDEHWPLAAGGSLADTVAYLRSVEFDGRPLHAWGFWNLLARTISNEARLCLADVEGTYALFSNWNALDAVFSVLADLTGTWHRLPDGYERLPDALREGAQHDGADVRTGCRLRAVSAPDGDGIRELEFEGGARVRARRVILAMPAGALARIDLDGERFGNALESVSPVAASKIFLVFDRPWWEEVPGGPGHIERGSFAASHTDLPLRQCYYLGTDPATGDGLVLGGFGDNRSVEFWPPMMSDQGREVPLRCRPSAAALEELRRQLSAMHGVEVPEPVDAVYVDWSSPPYHAGWHSWRPGWKSWEAAALLRGAKGLHVCGEAYSAYQGWVEGALTSAEMLLTETLGMEPPDWLADSGCLAPYRSDP